MKPKNYEVLMDIYMGVLNAPAIQFTTEDFGMCQITFSLLEDRITPYNLSNCLVRMVINGQQQDCTISDANNGKAEIVLLQSMFSEVGPVFAELQIYDATNQTMRLTTPTFKYTVRKSLMDDNTVQADPNYSILQNMILEVSSADEVAKQAKKTAESAMATANQAESKANQIMSNGDYAKEQGDYAKAEGDRLQGMLTLGGAPQTNFDFIKNKVAQDGLKHLSKINVATVKSGINVQNSTDDFDIMIIVNEITDVAYSSASIIMGQDNNSAKMDMRFQLTGGDYRVGIWISGITNIPVLRQKERPRYIGFKRKNGIYYSYTDTKVLELGYTSEEIYFTNVVFGARSTEHKGFITPIAYSRELYQEERECIFSILNNLPSIKELHTTDSTGKTSILNFASSEDHVEMASGRTLREEYMGVLKTMGKEFVSSGGSPVEVNNGIEARVINAEIKGQTVKSIANVDDRFRTAVGDGTIKVALAISDIGLVKPSSDYTLVTEVISNTLNGDFKLVNINTSNMMMDTNDSVPAGKTGIFIVKLRSKANLSGTSQIIRHALTADSTSGSITYRSCVFEGDLTKVVKGFAPFGLVSTEAIISNNGEEYPIYANEEDKTNRKVISLPFAEDKVILNEDGSQTWDKVGSEYVFDGNEDITIVTDYPSDKFIQFTTINEFLSDWATTNSSTKVTDVICDKLPVSSDVGDWKTPNKQVLNLGVSTNKKLLFTMDRRTCNTVDEFKAFIKGAKVLYKTTLIVTHLTKEITPAILTHNKTNILEVGGAVKPSSFKVTVPVDKLAEIEARLQALESTTVDVVLNK